MIFFTKEIVDQRLSIQDFLYWTIAYFDNSNIWYGHGTTNSWDEALQLVLPSLCLPLDALKNMCASSHLITFDEKEFLMQRVIRRVNERIPVAYIINKAWFCGHEFYVDKRVFIPRSPISELINNRFSGLIDYQPKYILDMCTGSGCIAISCAYAFPKAEIHAVDISLDALAVTKYNIKKHKLINRVIPISSDLFNKLLPVQQYDLIITNPPYVSTENISKLPDEYHHEPKISLLAGHDGLQIVHRILSSAANYLIKNGILICEVGNSMTRLMNRYPKVPFIWLNFNYGGDGVFILSKEEIFDIFNSNSNSK